MPGTASGPAANGRRALRGRTIRGLRGVSVAVQASFFDEVDRNRSGKLMQAVDRLNHVIGDGTVRFAAVGMGREQAWKTAFNLRTQSYTISWGELLEVG